MNEQQQIHNENMLRIKREAWKGSMAAFGNVGFSLHSKGAQGPITYDTEPYKWDSYMPLRRILWGKQGQSDQNPLISKRGN